MHTSPRYRSPGRRLTVFLALAVAVTAALFGSDPAGAHYVRVNWSHKNNNCTKITDPVTVVFYGSVLSGRVWIDVRHHTGWEWNDRDSFAGIQIAHDFKNGHGGCDEQHNELANKSGPLHSRFHTRFSNTQHRDSNGKYHVFLTPHHEVWRGAGTGDPGCGIGSHAVDPGHHDPDNKDNEYYETGNRKHYSGFDHGRDQLIGHMFRDPRAKRHHSITQHQWRNTRSVKQCNGWYSGASGVAFGITIGKRG